MSDQSTNHYRMILNSYSQDSKSTNQVDMPKEGEMAPEEQQAYEL